MNATVFNDLDFTCELMSPFLDTFAKEQKITTCLNEGEQCDNDLTPCLDCETADRRSYFGEQGCPVANIGDLAFSVSSGETVAEIRYKYGAAACDPGASGNSRAANLIFRTKWKDQRLRPRPLPLLTLTSAVQDATPPTTMELTVISTPVPPWQNATVAQP